MKNLNKKSAALLIAVAVLLLATVGGTLAYLTDKTDAVTNVFTPTGVKTEIVEDFDGSVKKSIVIANDENSIDVYIRVALVGNWVKNGNIIRPWTPDEDMPLGDFWAKHSDGYYYYTMPVMPDNSTTNLLGTAINATPTAEGETLEVTVIQQAIQADPKSVVKDTWGVEPESLRAAQ